MPEAQAYAERDFSGPEKAAALLLMMGKPPAARILKQFDPPELRSVARAAAGLGAVPPSRSTGWSRNSWRASRPARTSSATPARREACSPTPLPPDEIANILDPGAGEAEPDDAWRSLAQAPESAIIALLIAERPATAAYILSKLDPAVAASVVAALPRDRRNAALCGMVAPLAAPPLAARLVEEAVLAALKAASKAPAAARRALAHRDHHQRPRSGKGGRCQCAPSTSPAEGRRGLRGMLFGFNDLPRLSERARALLFDRASIDIVVMALRGTDAEFRDVVLSSMPSRGRRLVEGELNSTAYAPPQEIAKARKAIAEIVLGMASRNEIELARPVDRKQ